MYFRCGERGSKDWWRYNTLRARLKERGGQFSRAKAVIVDPVTCVGFSAMAVTCIREVHADLRKTSDRMTKALRNVEELHRSF